MNVDVRENHFGTVTEGWRRGLHVKSSQVRSSLYRNNKGQCSMHKYKSLYMCSVHIYVWIVHVFHVSFRL